MAIINDNGSLKSDAGKYIRRIGETSVYKAVLVGSDYQHAADWEEADYAPVAEDDITDVQVDEREQWLEILKRSVNLDDLMTGDQEAAKYKRLYKDQRKWSAFVGKELKAGERVYYNGDLYKMRQAINPVLANQPPSVATAALYERIDETHAGTEDDPIPYPHDCNMEIEEGKYYKEAGILYLCTRDSGIPIYCPLRDVVDNYVTVIKDYNKAEENQ